MKRTAASLSDSEMERIETVVAARFPRVLPGSWIMKMSAANARSYVDGVNAVILEAEMIGMDVWIHMSISHARRLPTWEELRDAKEIFIGRDRKAVQVLPPHAEYVNVNPHVLHLYSKVDGDPLPDFRMAGGI